MEPNVLARLAAVFDRRAPIQSIICNRNAGLPSRPMTASAPRETYLIAQLEESASYLRDEGWYQTAVLLLAAAREIESLRREVSGIFGR